MDARTLREEIDRFDPAVPIEAAWTPPSSWYTERAFHDLERRAVFTRTWQPVARVDQVAEPGAYVAGCFAGEPWILVRDEGGVLRAFHNVCRHKGREVLTGQGRADQLVCGYHAWTYDLSGRLRSAPRLAGIQGFDREAMSLVPLRVEVWGPWVFINGDPDARPLGPRVAELDAVLARGGWDRLKPVDRRTWTLSCNWKVYIDNYLDGGYHIPHMHPTLDAQLDMATYRTVCFDELSIQTSGPAPSGDSRVDLDVGARIGDGALYAWIYPNFMINRYGPCLDTNHVIPLGHDRCQIVYEFFFLDTEGAEAEQFIARSIEQSGVTQREDIEICESVQLGLQSSAYDRGRYAPRVEVGEHHFHRLLAADLRRGAPRPRAPGSGDAAEP